jgi:phage gpG-like protein
MSEQVDQAITAYLEKLASAIETDARAGCPVKTGTLARSITHEVHGKTARIGTNVDYAIDVELGTRPHLIYPKKPGGMLAFYWEKVGADVVLPFVHHPGTPAQPYLAPALYRQRGSL